MTGGPFETEREARAAADHTGLTGPVPIRNRDMLTRACWAAHVQLGAFDTRILSWLTGFEPATCAVVAGLITRAYDAGRASTGAAQLSALADSIDERLDNENADRQTIAEDVAAQLRKLAGGAR